MKFRKSGLKWLGALAVMLSIICVQPVSAQFCIPEGATIESATLSLYVATAGNETVNVHRITALWDETVVTWNNFGGAYDIAVEGSFVTDGAFEWRSADVTALVQDWVDGSHPNYGMLLEQGSTQYSTYRSSEYSPVELRPMLEICYTDSGGTDCVTIQRPGADQDGVADTYIWELLPDNNAGTSPTLFTGLLNGYEKQSLLWFDFEICDEPPLECRVTGGGVDDFGEWNGRRAKGKMNAGDGMERYTFGGQAGAPTASQPQPYGEWTHANHRGPSGKFTFHAGTSSAIPGTEIDWVECSDPDNCVPARTAPAKQIDFEGIGSFRNLGGNCPFEGPVEHETLHWFTVHIEDLGEPGKGGKVDPPADTCPPEGSAGALADCDCPDFYHITIYATDDPGSDVIYEVWGYIIGGNLQIHPPIH